MGGSNRTEQLMYLDMLNNNKEKKKEDKSLLPGKKAEESR